VLGTFAIVRHERLNSSTYDLGIKDQVIWNTSRGRWFASSVEVGHYLGDHVQLIFLPVALLYRIWPSVHLLLGLQALGLASGALPLYVLVRSRFQRTGPALLFAAAYLLYPAVGFINRFDFHAVSLAVPLFLFAYWALDVRRLWLASLLALAALSLREEVGLTVAALALYAWWARGERAWGMAWATIGIAWSLVTLFVIIPAFRGTASDTLGRYEWLGASAPEMLYTLVTRPGFVIRHQFLASPLRWRFLLKLLLPVGFLSLFGPAVLAIGLPALAYNLLSDAPPQSSIYFQYLSPIIPFVFLAALEGMAWLGQRLADPQVQRRWRWTMMGLVSVGTLAAFALDNPFTKPIREPYFEIYAWEQRLDRGAFDRVAGLLPADASVSTMMAYGPHLAHRQELYVFYDKGARDAKVFRFPQTDYLLLNLDDMRWLVNQGLFYPMIESAIGWHGYEALAFEGNVALLQKDAPPRPETADLLAHAIARWEAGAKNAPVSDSVRADIAALAQRERLPADCVEVEVQFGQQIELSCAQVTPHEFDLDEERVVNVSLYWRRLQAMNEDYVLFIHITDLPGWVHAQRDTRSGWGFYPTSTWPEGVWIEDMRSIPLPEHLPPGEYVVRVGWYALPSMERLPAIEGGQQVGDVVEVARLVVR
jgi:uncharacterized membrane protein